MRILFALIIVFFISSFANASEFELNVYFNLSASEKHGFVRCRPGDNKLKAEYHLIVIRNEPKYTILSNSCLNDDVIGNVRGVGYCNEGNFILSKSISNSKDSINSPIYLVETYHIKDSIFDVAKIELSSTEDYFIESRFIDETGQAIVRKGNAKGVVSSKKANPVIDDGSLLYRNEIKRKSG